VVFHREGRDEVPTLLIALASDAELGPEARRAFESIGAAASQLPIELRAAGKRFGSHVSIRLADTQLGAARRSARFVVLDPEQSVLGDASTGVAHLERFSLYFAIEPTLR
jgi:hypothetical protein